MLATRFGLKAIPQNPAVFKSTVAVPAIGVRHFNASHKAQEQCAAAESELLRQQRKVRPVSPHLTIYQPQITWYLSGAHRVTGAAIGGAFYLGALAYVAAPALGGSIDAASIISAATGAPFAAKVIAKTTVAAPFVFHSLNGIRHLVWDMGKCLNIKQVYSTGYAVLAASAVGSLYLGFM